MIDERGIGGVVRQAQLERAVSSGEGAKHLKELAGAAPIPHLHADHPLDLALERMGAAKVDILPVVSRADIRVVLGAVTLPDILDAFGVSHPDAESLAERIL